MLSHIRCFFLTLNVLASEFECFGPRARMQNDVRTETSACPCVLQRDQCGISAGSSGSERDGRVCTGSVRPAGGSRVRWAPGKGAPHTTHSGSSPHEKSVRDTRPCNCLSHPLSGLSARHTHCTEARISCSSRAGSTPPPPPPVQNAALRLAACRWCTRSRAGDRLVPAPGSRDL